MEELWNPPWSWNQYIIHPYPKIAKTIESVKPHQNCSFPQNQSTPKEIPKPPMHVHRGRAMKYPNIMKSINHPSNPKTVNKIESIKQQRNYGFPKITQRLKKPLNHKQSRRPCTVTELSNPSISGYIPSNHNQKITKQIKSIKAHKTVVSLKISKPLKKPLNH